MHEVETGECHTLEDPICAGLFPEAQLAAYWRAHDGRRARHVQLIESSASIGAVATIPSTLRASSASRVTNASACS